MVASMQIEIGAGTSIETASKDAQRIAVILGINVEFRFNDVRCLAVPEGDAKLLAERQQAEQAKKLDGPFDRRFASSRRSQNAVAEADI